MMTIPWKVRPLYRRFPTEFCWGPCEESSQRVLIVYNLWFSPSVLTEIFNNEKTSWGIDGVDFSYWTHLLGKTCGKFAGLVHVVPGDVLADDGPEVRQSDTMSLPGGSPYPAGNHDLWSHKPTKTFWLFQRNRKPSASVKSINLELQTSFCRIETSLKWERLPGDHLKIKQRRINDKDRILHSNARTNF